MKFRIVDLETTGFEAADSVVEIGVVDYIPSEDSLVVEEATFIFPGRDIPYTATAIHHITDDMVMEAPRWEATRDRLITNPAQAGDITAFVAHNADFEAKWLTEEARCGIPFICTYKSSLRVWPDLESHSNQALRYALKLDLEEQRAMPPHRALPDAYVTAFILRELMKHANIHQLIEWSKEPPLYKKVSFGKHKGMLWPELPSDYLLWILEKSDLDDNTKWMARRILRRRAYVTAGIQIVKIAKTANDLVTWWKDEADHRAEHDIVKGDSDFQTLVNACATRKAEVVKEAA